MPRGDIWTHLVAAPSRGHYGPEYDYCSIAAYGRGQEHGATFRQVDAKVSGRCVSSEDARTFVRKSPGRRASRGGASFLACPKEKAVAGSGATLEDIFALAKEKGIPVVLYWEGGAMRTHEVELEHPEFDPAAAEAVEYGRHVVAEMEKRGAPESEVEDARREVDWLADLGRAGARARARRDRAEMHVFFDRFYGSASGATLRAYRRRYNIEVREASLGTPPLEGENHGKDA